MRRSGGVFRELQCEERVQKGKSKVCCGLWAWEGTWHTLQPGRSTAALQIWRQGLQTLEDWALRQHAIDIKGTKRSPGDGVLRSKVHLEVLKSFANGGYGNQEMQGKGRGKKSAVEGTLKVSFTLHFTELGVTIKAVRWPSVCSTSTHKHWHSYHENVAQRMQCWDSVELVFFPQQRVLL